MLVITGTQAPVRATVEIGTLDSFTHNCREYILQPPLEVKIGQHEAGHWWATTQYTPRHCLSGIGPDRQAAILDLYAALAAIYSRVAVSAPVEMPAEAEVG